MKLFKNKKQDPSAPGPNKKSSKKKKSGLGFALYALAALILLVFTLVNQERIARNLKTTGFFSKTGLKAPSFIENAVVEEEDLSNKNDVEPEGPIQIDLNDSGAKATVKKSITPRNKTAQEQEEAAAEDAEHPDADRLRYAAPNIDYIGKLLYRKAPRRTDEDLQIHRLFLFEELVSAEAERKRRHKKRYKPENDVLHIASFNIGDELRSSGCLFFVAADRGGLLFPHNEKHTESTDRKSCDRRDNGNIAFGQR